MQPLSISIITFNEEKNIARCLDSVKDIANEIVVIDSNSTDNTENICKQYGVKFYSQKFLGYIEQKNVALDHCKYNYVLCLDADECLSPTLIQSIKQQKQNDFIYDSYTMNRCNNFCGKWIKYGSWYPDTKLRLFNKKKGKWAGVNPHDKIEMEPNCSHHFLKGNLLHYSYHNIDEMLAQNNKFTTIQAQAMLLQGKRSNVLKLIINPFIAFIKGYFVKRGFMNGIDGFFIEKTVAYYTMVKYYKLMQLQLKGKK
jgi:glycosyltransferase involved in cell wall biosynthesis